MDIVLKHFIGRAGYSVSQLSRLTGIPKATLMNWFSGRVKKPRSREDLIKLAAALHLNEEDASLLLESAAYPTISDLIYSSANERERQLLAPWRANGERPSTYTPFQAIPDLPYFVGRQEEIDALGEALQAETHASVYYLDGMPGVGKTVLATRLAYLLRPHFLDGVLFGQLDLSDSMSILSTFARAYGCDVTKHINLNSRSQVVRDLLASKRALIILDNPNSSQQIRPLLPPTGTCAVLVTTRRSDLWEATGARRFHLEPFSQENQEALQLFKKILGPEKLAHKPETFEEIADLLGHHPLAIAISASRLAYEPSWSPEALLNQLRQSHRRLDILSFDDQSVRHLFDRSVRSILPGLQRFFRCLSVFGSAEFAIGPAAQVAGTSLQETQEKLRKLVCMSLLESQEPGKYRLHPLVSDWIQE